jgi:hypothetical protein
MKRPKRDSELFGLIPMDWRAWVASQGLSEAMAGALMVEAMVAGYNAALTAAIAELPQHADVLVDLIAAGVSFREETMEKIVAGARAILKTPASPDVAAMADKS